MDRVLLLLVLSLLNISSTWGQTETPQFDFVNRGSDYLPTESTELAPPAEGDPFYTHPDVAEPSQGDFAEQFWQYLQTGPMAYDEWRGFPGRPEGLQTGRSPHGSKVRLVANRKARESAEDPVPGSILLMENLNSSGTRVISITVMYRVNGYDPPHGDWFWAKYQMDGKLARIDGRRAAGRINSCIECHQAAAGGDYIFANDGVRSAPAQAAAGKGATGR
ncbi:MAG: cytochrome P460 family protein [Planctomycetota bacterium]